MLSCHCTTYNCTVNGCFAAVAVAWTLLLLVPEGYVSHYRGIADGASCLAHMQARHVFNTSCKGVCSLWCIGVSSFLLRSVSVYMLFWGFECRQAEFWAKKPGFEEADYYMYQMLSRLCATSGGFCFCCKRAMQVV